MCRIYERYKDEMLSVAHMLLGDVAAAEDVVHDVFVSFAQRVGKLRLRGSLRNYLVVSIRNEVCDRRRKSGRERGVGDVDEAMASDGEGPDEAAGRREVQARLEVAMLMLPHEQREAILLHHKGGLKFREIGDVQGVSLNTAQGRYRQGIEKLRSMLEEKSEIRKSGDVTNKANAKRGTDPSFGGEQ